MASHLEIPVGEVLAILDASVISDIFTEAGLWGFLCIIIALSLAYKLSFHQLTPGELMQLTHDPDAE